FEWDSVYPAPEHAQARLDQTEDQEAAETGRVVEPVRQRMKIVFCGTPQFAVPTLKFLLTQNEFEIAAVITQPDRPSGRGMTITASPVKEAAVAAGVPVHQPEKIRSPEMQATLGGIAPDCVVIIAYGQIIPA